MQVGNQILFMNKKKFSVKDVSLILQKITSYIKKIRIKVKNY